MAEEKKACDFCYASEVYAIYDAEDFSFPYEIMVSEGAWMACETCSKLVDAQDWEALADRACATHKTNYPETVMLPFYRQIILDSYRTLGTKLKKHN